ncbi:MAG TPA: acyl-ACP--UDP-N-acetylglucosamine O-acyltransferase [Flavisolibacter sp.]|nr:acyl-ACP--UDP-N-acetylglucosamine O-acyltransferase [Flavisolibacter sp.]
MISPLASIHPNAQLGNNVTVDPFAVIQENVIIGDDTHIMSHAVIMPFSRIGKGCKIHPGAVIGGVPQDLKFVGEETTAEIGDYTTIRECVTVNRGTKDKFKTVVGSNCLLMAYAHVAHDCVVGDHVILANAVQLAGHVEVGDYAILSGLAAVNQFTRIGAHTYIGGQSAVRKDVPPYTKAAREPLAYMGVNIVGLHRRNFHQHEIQSISQIYHLIFVGNHSIPKGIEIVKEQVQDSKIKEEILSFIQNSKIGIIKRYSKNGVEEDED